MTSLPFKPLWTSRVPKSSDVACSVTEDSGHDRIIAHPEKFVGPSDSGFEKFPLKYNSQPFGLQRVYLHCNGLRKQDVDNLAYELTLILHREINNVFGDKLEIVRFLPCSPTNTYSDQIHVMLPNSVAFFIKCKPVHNDRRIRLSPMIESSIFDQDGFGATLNEYMQFFAAKFNPMWLTQAVQTDYYLIKRSIIPIAIDIGRYKSVRDYDYIKSGFTPITTSVIRALDSHFDNPIL